MTEEREGCAVRIVYYLTSPAVPFDPNDIPYVRMGREF